MLLKPFAEICNLLLRQEHADDLIATFADLPSHNGKFDVDSIISEGFNPRPGMHIDGIDQRSVDIEDNGFNHRSDSQPANVQQRMRMSLSG